jgi:hypothetical protein
MDVTTVHMRIIATEMPMHVKPTWRFVPALVAYQTPMMRPTIGSRSERRTPPIQSDVLASFLGSAVDCWTGGETEDIGLLGIENGVRAFIDQKSGLL